MPTSLIKKDAREGKGTTKNLEKKWDNAKDASKKSTGKGDDWALTNYIYQKMRDSSKSKKHASVELNAASRVLATEVLADAFEDWVNTLDYKYERPEGADYVIVDAPMEEVVEKLYANDWARARRSDIAQFMKGKQSVILKAEGKRTRITDQ